MKISKLLLAGLVGFAFTFTSCKKDDDDEASETSAPTQVTGSFRDFSISGSVSSELGTVDSTEFSSSFGNMTYAQLSRFFYDEDASDEENGDSTYFFRFYIYKDYDDSRNSNSKYIEIEGYYNIESERLVEYDGDEPSVYFYEEFAVDGKRAYYEITTNDDRDISMTLNKKTGKGSISWDHEQTANDSDNSANKAATFKGTFDFTLPYNELDLLGSGDWITRKKN